MLWSSSHLTGTFWLRSSGVGSKQEVHKVECYQWHGGAWWGQGAVVGRDTAGGVLPGPMSYSSGTPWPVDGASAFENSL